MMMPYITNNEARHYMGLEPTTEAWGNERNIPPAQTPTKPGTKDPDHTATVGEESGQTQKKAQTKRNDPVRIFSKRMAEVKKHFGFGIEDVA